MAFDRLQSPAVIGTLYERLSAQTGAPWIEAVSGPPISSSQEIETYARLGMVPAMRQWIGGRQAKGLRDTGQTIKNLPYESTLEIPVDWMRRDKTGHIAQRIGEQAARAATHWASLLSTQILTGLTGLCDDGLPFFSASHAFGDSGTLSNIVPVTLSALEQIPSNERGTVADPSASVMKHAILNGIARFYTFRDDQGEPINEDARNFLVMVPTTLLNAARAAVSLPSVERGTANLIPSSPDFSVQVVANTRLDSANAWVETSPQLNSFAIFRTDGVLRPLIRQSEIDIEVSAQAEGSDIEFNDRVHRYGLYASRAVGYGYWPHANLVRIV